MTSSPGFEQRLQHGVERGPGAHRHQHVIRGVRQSGRLAQPPRDRLAHLRVAGVRHVGVQVRRVAVEHAPRRGQHGGRRLDLRIAEREVEDLVGAALLLEARALLEHAADPRRLGEIFGDGPRDHARSIDDAPTRAMRWAACSLQPSACSAPRSCPPGSPQSRLGFRARARTAAGRRRTTKALWWRPTTRR